MMKNTITIVGVLILFLSCKKELEEPSFEVSTTATTYNVNETVTFNFKGNPEILSFYPGTTGNNYEFKDRTQVTGNKLLLQFSSLAQRDNGDLRLLVSTNFNGKVDGPSITDATWVDITDRAVLSTGVDRTPSGVIDLSEFSNTQKPVVIAFKYATKVLKSPNSRWVIRTINLDSQSPKGDISSLATMATAGWLAYSFKNPAANWVVTTAQLLMDGGATELDEDWVISKGFDISSVNPDVGIALKNVSTNLSSYDYKFSEPGTYNVVFVAKNADRNGSKEIVKQVTLTIK